ncbi:MAG: radical SAM protein [Deltaproteobacteria bacterium]|nr:radical SAM protein [Deltaproteobacteria bacterium]
MEADAARHLPGVAVVLGRVEGRDQLEILASAPHPPRGGARAARAPARGPAGRAAGEYGRSRAAGRGDGEERATVITPGRVDQLLWPYYRADVKRGALERARALRLVEELVIKLNNNVVIWPNIGGVRLNHLGSDVENITLGGVDADGHDATNALSYLFIEAVTNTRLATTASFRVSKESRPEYLRRVVAIHRDTSSPAFLNDETAVAALVNDGYTVAAAREYCLVGCVEPSGNGDTYGATGGTKVYFPTALDLVFNRGKTTFFGNQDGIDTGDPAKLRSFDQVLDAFYCQLESMVEWVTRATNLRDAIWAERFHNPLISCTIDGCIETGRDMTAGGARYNFGAVGGGGLGTVVDSLAAIRTFVFEERSVSMGELARALHTNFLGREALRRRLAGTPRFGNDLEPVDGLARDLVARFCEMVSERRTYGGGHYKASLISYGLNVYEGALEPASADGRRAGEPLSNSMSPSNGAERRGPTAALSSLARHAPPGGDPAVREGRRERRAPGAGVLQQGRLPRAVQLRRLGDAPRRAGAPGRLRRPGGARVGLFGLLHAPRPPHPGRHHRAHRVHVVLAGGPTAGAAAPGGRVFDVQRFSIHDGPGIRTTVFFEGCPLRCAWCQNPEGFASRRADAVPIEAILAEVLRDRDYYAVSGGGLTVSGGEPLLDPGPVRALLEAARRAGLHTCVQTSAAVPRSHLAAVLDVVDLFQLDLKHMDPRRHAELTGMGTAGIHANARFLLGRGVPVELRMPVLPGINDDAQNLGAVARFVTASCRPGARTLHLVPYHRLYLDKYAALGLTPRLADLAVPPRDAPARGRGARAARRRRRGRRLSASARPVLDRARYNRIDACAEVGPPPRRGPHRRALPGDDGHRADRELREHVHVGVRSRRSPGHSPLRRAAIHRLIAAQRLHAGHRRWYMRRCCARHAPEACHVHGSGPDIPCHRAPALAPDLAAAVVRADVGGGGVRGAVPAGAAQGGSHSRAAPGAPRPGDYRRRRLAGRAGGDGGAAAPRELRPAGRSHCGRPARGRGCSRSVRHRSPRRSRPPL